MEAVWHAMEYFGNTILFVLCGLFAYESCKKAAWEDFGWLILLYILANLARAFMVALLWPIVNMVGGSDVTPLACLASSCRSVRCMRFSAQSIPVVVYHVQRRRTTWKECAVQSPEGVASDAMQASQCTAISPRLRFAQLCSRVLVKELPGMKSNRALPRPSNDF